jgi:hypothetical protein
VTFLYQVYGVGIESNAVISGLEPLENISEISLRFESGSAPEWVKDAQQLRGRVLAHRGTEETAGEPTFTLTEYGESEYYGLSYAEGASFLVNQAANRVWGAFEPPLTIEDLATYFLGPVLGFVLRQRHVTCLHASSVELHGQGVVFSGDAGQGKSTTAGALALRGVPVVAEDIVALELTESTIWVRPGYPRVCLWPDAVHKLVGDAEAFPKLTPTWEKRYLPLDGVHGKFAAQKVPLGLIYIFAGRIADANAPWVEEVNPREGLLELVQKTYMNWLLDRERRAKEFHDLWKVVGRIPVRRIFAHEDPSKIGELCDLILTDAARVLGSVNV